MRGCLNWLVNRSVCRLIKLAGHSYVWDRDPWCTINAASMHHIYAGRWLKDPRFMDGYINYLLGEGGNDRRYSESVADAAFARYLVNGDSVFLIAHLERMKQIFDAWSDH